MACERGESPAGIHAFPRHVWLNFWREVVRLRGEDVAGEAERLVALS